MKRRCRIDKLVLCVTYLSGVVAHPDTSFGDNRTSLGDRSIVQLIEESDAIYAGEAQGDRKTGPVEIIDGKNQPVARATLRCLAKTHVTFRDHDSANQAVQPL